MDFLTVKNLYLSLKHHQRELPILKGVSLSIQRNETLGIVGESGSGKTMLMKFLLGLSPRNAFVSFEKFSFENADVVPPSFLRTHAAMILQDPHAALNPVLTVEQQLQEVFTLKGKKNNIKEHIFWALEEVSIKEPQRVSKSYPFELSGGMAQRVMIAIMLALRPKILIADEPTSSLDVQVQKQILDLLHFKAEEHSMTLIMISHDLPLISRYANRVLVMRQGCIVDSCNAADLKNSSHPYTRGLFECLPILRETRKRLPVIE